MLSDEDIIARAKLLHQWTYPLNKLTMPNVVVTDQPQNGGGLATWQLVDDVSTIVIARGFQPNDEQLIHEDFHAYLYALGNRTSSPPVLDGWVKTRELSGVYVRNQGYGAVYTARAWEDFAQSAALLFDPSFIHNPLHYLAYGAFGKFADEELAASARSFIVGLWIQR